MSTHHARRFPDGLPRRAMLTHRHTQIAVAVAGPLKPTHRHAMMKGPIVRREKRARLGPLIPTWPGVRNGPYGATRRQTNLGKDKARLQMSSYHTRQVRQRPV